ncbi:MAG: trehalose-phosphatase [Terriglobales bacterium]
MARASKRLLMIDYDGTLAPFLKERDQAFPYPGIAAAVQEMIVADHTRVVIVSGRAIDALIPLLGIQPLPEVWGSHGFQRRRPNGILETAHIEQRDLDALSEGRHWLEYQGLLSSAEFKTGSIAVHWRGETNRKMQEVRMRVLLGWKAVADLVGLDILEFDCGIELRVRGTNKGDVVRMLLKEVGPGIPAAYLGDDSTDEDAFRTIQGQGLSVLVRPQWRPTAAQCWLRPHEDVLDFLAQWLEACRSGHARNGAIAEAVHK